MQQANVESIPLHRHTPPNPTWWRAVVSSCYFHTAVQVHYPLTEFIKAERFQWQWQQVWSLFSKHRRHLPFGSAMNTRISPTRFPAIEVSLRLLQILEALA